MIDINIKKLIVIKSIHTAIWIFYVFVFGYILFAGIFNRIDGFLWITIGLVILEGIILIVNRWKCPLTVIAYKYSNDHEIGFDIFLPRIIAKYNKTFFAIVFTLEILLILYRVIEIGM